MQIHIWILKILIGSNITYLLQNGEKKLGKKYLRNGNGNVEISEK